MPGHGRTGFGGGVSKQQLGQHCGAPHLGHLFIISDPQCPQMSIGFSLIPDAVWSISLIVGYPISILSFGIEQVTLARTATYSCKQLPCLCRGVH